MANIFGMSIYIYWLVVDYEGIKVFLTSIFALAYGGLKIWEKWIDVREKKRKSDQAHTSRRRTRNKENE